MTRAMLLANVIEAAERGQRERGQRERGQRERGQRERGQRERASARGLARPAQDVH
jgi:hypothetical protein